MKFIPRSGFVKTSLESVLSKDPTTMDVYIAEDTDSDKHSVYVLRIHSSLWHYAPNTEHLWYEKRVPWHLHTEDVLPWFQATIKKLPKRKKPRDATPWEENLLRSDPELAPPILALDAQWHERPKLILVFGTRDEIGYAAMYHLERQRIQGLRRTGSETRYALR